MAEKEYISREAAIELLSEPITMSMCLSTEECHHKIAQQRIDRYLIENIPAADVREVKWIPVTERLPDEDGKYLCTVRSSIQYNNEQYRFVDILVFQEGCFFECGIGTERVTHWMPLPEPPKEE